VDAARAVAQDNHVEQGATEAPGGRLEAAAGSAACRRGGRSAVKAGERRAASSEGRTSVQQQGFQSSGRTGGPACVAVAETRCCMMAMAKVRDQDDI
jgi:hypothetical protein